ncbi:uncharacterized protein LOC124456390 [Xenia sp. Carnegie-2017]|uniref:uncharacterized protein LOC124456390 n=1 Tax=Xenia sp. Carnegie-2017 TaxID=2897299 RepID=UPI001F03CECA|nr:uncharacterized protein LOC124456390 [Xenia sp. Carnegie-2017]
MPTKLPISMMIFVKYLLAKFSLPILWMRESPDFKRSDKKRIVWANLAKKLNRDVNFLKNKWKNLCDSFKKCLDRERDMSRSGAGAYKAPRCRYFSQLAFLRDTLSNRTTHSNVTIQSVEPQHSQHQSPSSSTSSEPISCAEGILNQSFPNVEPQATIVHRKRKKNDDMDPIDHYLINAIKEKDQGSDKKEHEDEDFFFCKSIVDVLRKFPRKKSLEVKIQQILLEEMDDE